MMLTAALNYAARGFQVFPLIPDGKTPLLSKEDGGNGHLDATTDPDQIRALFNKPANIGLRPDSNVVVLDFDVRNGQPGLKTLADLISKGLPADTLHASTPSGGWHYLYTLPEGVTIANTSKVQPGTDTRTIDGYIAVEPSKTKDGCYQWADPTAEILPAPQWLIDLLPKKEKAKQKKSFSSPEKIPAGGRNDTLFKLTCSLIQKGLDPLTIRAAILQENKLKCTPPLPDSEIDLILTAAERYRNETPERQETLTDLGNAERLIRHHGDKIRYVNEYKKWIGWNDSRWSFDLPSGIHPLAHKLAKTDMVQEALTLPTDKQNKLILHSIKSQSAGAINAMIEVASKLSGVPIRVSSLDSNRYLLNTLNGTIDLKIGLHRAANREDYITKQAPVEYDADATCPLWDSFLHRIMAGNESLIAFLRRAVGYSLTGDTGEQCFFFLHGHGANGKSTFLNTVCALLGDYAMQAPAEILMANDNRGPKNDVARLNGPRFVATSETEDTQKFAESAIKQLTGQDTIAARFLYCETFEFKPQFKIWLAANHLPIVKGVDEAIWRRIHLVPFGVTIPAEERDKHLEAKLIKELPGILNWALAGCKEWQRDGLQPPAEVQAAVQGYRNDMDQFGQWIIECCVIAPKGKEQEIKTGSADLYKSYCKWADENTGWVMSQTKFGRTLTDRGFIRVLTPRAVWHGIGLLTIGGQGY